MLNERTPSEKFDKFWLKEELPQLKGIIKDNSMIEVVRLTSKNAYLQGVIDGALKAEEILLGKNV